MDVADSKKLIAYLEGLQREGEQIKFLRAKNGFKAFALGVISYFALDSIFAIFLVGGLCYVILDAILENYRATLLLDQHRAVAFFTGNCEELDQFIKRIDGL